MSQRRCWIRSHEDGCHFGSGVFSAAPFHPALALQKGGACVYLRPSQNYVGTTPKSCLLVTQSLLLLLLLLPPISVPALPRSFAPPTGLALLLTGVICASRIDVVCRPIKIFEGNVYFLERIAAAAWKPFLNKAIYA